MSTTNTAASPSSTVPGNNKLSPTANTKPNRLPAPTLFVAPPSRNASQLSISRTATHESKNLRDPLIRQKSALSRPLNADITAANGSDADSPQDNKAQPSKLQKASEKNVEARWKEMQNTLNEVEFTAQSSTHVFGEKHTAALDELRRAQIQLAQAWGRGSENKPTGVESDLELNVNRFKGAEDLALDRQQARKRTNTNASASTALSDESTQSDFTARSGGRSQLEDETAQDIKLAGERRAANEAYFQKVDSGVKDVVAKLEAVAEAMRGVESESRSLWSDSGNSGSNIDGSTSNDEGTTLKGKKQGQDQKQETG